MPKKPRHSNRRQQAFDDVSTQAYSDECPQWEDYYDTPSSPGFSSANEALFEDPNHPARWKHRRRMAYMAMYSMLILTAYAMSPWIDIERLEHLSDIIEWFYFAMASIVGAYMGFATWSAKTGKVQPMAN